MQNANAKQMRFFILGNSPINDHVITKKIIIPPEKPSKRNVHKDPSNNVYAVF